MDAPLYTPEILRLAASIPFDGRLESPMARAERRSPTCGSRITIDIDMDGDGRIARIGMLVRSCALGQASAAILAEHAVGRRAADIAAARDALAAWLAGERADAPAWPGLPLFAGALSHRGRHPSIRLAFEAAAQAAGDAEARLAAEARG